ncbi:MAG: DUF839 domain-containing protein [Myxococcota bacterium]
MIVALVLLGCSGESTPTPDPVPDPAPVAPAPDPKRDWTLEFNNVKIEDSMLMATAPTSTTWAMVDGKRADIDFMRIYTRGEDGFGDLVDGAGAPIDDVCNNQDFDAVLEAAGHPWLVSHFECTPGEIYLTRLKKDADGKLSPDFNKRVDFSAVGGVWNPCAGVVSPWGTHVGSEEYEPNARVVPQRGGKDTWDARAWFGQERYLPGGGPLQPYLYGWTPEVRILDADGNTSVVKHKAPGRFSHEVAYILPDERTVYLSDDGGAEGFFMFVADRPKDLSSGYLYAARWKQRTAQPIEAEISWINLGHADNASIDALIGAGVTFDDLFEVAEPNGFVCPDGFRFTHTDYEKECLKLREPSEKVPDPAMAASRLETRRYAAVLAATTEFEKGEGVTFDPATGRVFISLSKVTRRMLEEPGAPDDHIKLPENDCGVILEGKTDKGVVDSSKNLIGSLHVITGFEQVVAGTPLDQPDPRGNTCFENGIANPDNITYLPGYDILMVGEDTSAHAVASLWAIEDRKHTLKRVLVSPPHGEITGIHWTPNLQGHGYLTVAVQHPWKAETLEDTQLPEGITAEHQKSITGILGPFPALD